jgi:hypothetical protein|tara:strand:- start:813 stop:980 length:168 start_codon:yes stop_codon:yes gene_type:complete
MNTKEKNKNKNIDNNIIDKEVNENNIVDNNIFINDIKDNINNNKSIDNIFIIDTI